jgi:phosphoglycerate kinase
LGVAKEIMTLAGSRGVAFRLPEDFVIASEVAAEADTSLISKAEPVPKGYSIVDIGEQTLVQFVAAIEEARTIFWNGPVGVFEIGDFAGGTFKIARSVAAATQAGAVSIIGGGDTASAVAKAGVRDRVTHISTGGGASLEFVEGKELPGIAALTQKEA